ncbi:hypothetical protein BKG61_16990 [Mycobacterium syngnathidarum]|uniref:Uncharacterized protein n=1 Tax=Mycobacterium syngnathidarum TaxID=1908205 RepID=A0A1S1K0N3_9MYCO|nr:hypothetical protein BKG61_16990 [Mycobacterium syngnathidarum]
MAGTSLAMGNMRPKTKLNTIKAISAAYRPPESGALPVRPERIVHAIPLDSRTKDSPYPDFADQGDFG